MVAGGAALPMDGVAGGCDGGWESLRETETRARREVWDLVDDTSKCAFWFLILYFFFFKKKSKQCSLTK